MINRLSILVASAATMGAGLISIVSLADWVQRGGQSGPSLHETISLGLLSLIFRVAFPLARTSSLVFYTALAFFAASLIWRGTRTLAVNVATVAIGVVAVAAAALVCGLTYLFAPRPGALLPFVAILPAVALARRDWPMLALVIVAAGVAIGTFCAQITGVPGQSISSPLYGFVPPVLIGVVIAGVLSRFASSDQARHRLAQCWGLSTVCLSATFLVAIEAYHLRSRPAESTTVRILSDWAYDVYVPASPPDLVWSTRHQTYVLSDAYGERHTGFQLGDGHAAMGERIWRAENGDFYLQTSNALGWWHLADAHSIPHAPTAWIPKTEWYGEDSLTTSTFAEDPATGRLLVVHEWRSRYAVIDRHSASVLARGTLSDGVWPWWYATVDAAARVAFVSSAFDDGGLYELNLDTLQVTRSAPNFFMYETVLDTAAGTLWGVRPVSGEILGVDTRTLEIRSRIRVAVGVRDVQLDRQTGDLLTASVFTGDIYRIDRRSLTPSRIGWCGRLARNLYFDTDRRTLWIATADGVCRLPIPERPRESR